MPLPGMRSERLPRMRAAKLRTRANYPGCHCQDKLDPIRSEIRSWNRPVPGSIPVWNSIWNV